MNGGSNIRFGSIVWARVPDPRGHAKPNPRPVVVLTATDEIVLDLPVVGVAVSTRFALPLSDREVLLPSAPGGHPATNLEKQCVAVCNWLVQFLPSEVESVAGYVPGKTMQKIVSAVSRLNRDDQATS